MSKRITTEFYVQFRPDRWWSDPKQIHGMAAIGITQRKPTVVKPDCVVVKFRASLDTDAFELLPVVNVEVPLRDVAIAEAESVPAA